MRTLAAGIVAFGLAIQVAPDSGLQPVKAKGSGPLYLVKDSTRWGYMNRDGAVVISPQFDTAGDFFEGLAPATQGDKRGYINQSGAFEFLRPESYLGDFRDGLARVGFDPDGMPSDFYRLIDRHGNSVLQSDTVAAGRFSEGLAPVTSRGKYGFMDTNGAMTIPLVFDNARGFSEGLAPVATSDGLDSNRTPRFKWGFIDNNGAIVVPLKFDDLWPLRYGASIFWDSSRKRMGLIDRSGKTILPAQYLMIQDYGDNEGVRLFKADSSPIRSEFIRSDGSTAFVLEDMNGASMYRFSEGLARIVREDEVFFINDKGATVAAGFTRASDFSEGLAAAEKGLWGYIDRSGRWVIAPQFDGAKEFRAGLALVATGRYWHYLDTRGIVVRPNVWTCDISDDPAVRELFCGN